MPVKTLCAVVGFMAALLALAPLASADHPSDTPMKAFNLPDLSGLTSIGLDLQLASWTIPETAPRTESDILNTTIEVFADCELAPHWLLVARMPFVYTNEESHPVDLSDCCNPGAGNLTVGVRRLFSSVEDQGWHWVLGFDVLLSVATASDEHDRTASAAAKAAAAFARQTHDPGRYLPNTWTPRLTGHAQLSSTRFLLQAEAGLHFFLYDDVANDDYDLAVRVALAAGIRANAKLAFVLELNNMIFLAEDDRAELHFYPAILHSNETVSSIDVGLRYEGQGFAAGLRIFVPLDDSLRDLDMLGVGADVSARF
jgi:hypothetical protein